jgi:hypothetical protein
MTHTAPVPHAELVALLRRLLDLESAPLDKNKLYDTVCVVPAPV